LFLLDCLCIQVNGWVLLGINVDFITANNLFRCSEVIHGFFNAALQKISSLHQD
jgi:hypothetical protein